MSVYVILKCCCDSMFQVAHVTSREDIRPYLPQYVATPI